MKIFKKLISVVIAGCFVLSIANFPAYSAYNTIETIGSAQNQEEYNLQADYKTVKETIKAPAAPLATTSKVTSSSVKAKANQSIKLINNLLKKKATGKLAKTWLNKAKTLINKTLKSKKSNATKYAWLKKALTAITAISKAKASTLSLIKQTVTSGSVFSSLKTVLKKNATYKIYANYTAKIISSINKLVNKSSVSSLAKTWLKKAKTLAWNKMFGKGSNATKTKWLKKALTAVNNIAKSNGSVLSVVKQTIASGSVFSSLKTVLKNNITYKIYAKYGQSGINLINELSTKYKLDKTKIYNNFVNNKVTKKQMEYYSSFLVNYSKNGANIFEFVDFGRDWWGAEDFNIAKALASTEQLITNIEYKINRKYGEYGGEGANLIKELSSRYNLDKALIYNKFVQYNVTAEQLRDLSFTDDLKNDIDIFSFNPGEGYYSNVGSALAEIKKLIDNNNLIGDAGDENNNDDNNNEDKPYQQALNQSTTLISNLLNNNSTSALAKEWLNKAKTLINNVINGNGTDEEKQEFINNALISIQNVSNNNCSIEVLEQESSANSVFSSLQTTVLNNSAAYRAYKKTGEITSLITNLVNNNNTSTLAKSWLNAAQTKINEIMNSNKTDAEKETLLNSALTSIQNVSNNNCSIEVLEQESSANSVFSALQASVLNNSATYRAYKKNKEVTSLITSLVNNNNTSQLAKSWLNVAQTVINGIVNSNKTDTEKETLLNSALTSIQNISNNNCSIESLEQESSANSIFNALQASVLENNSTYKVYKKGKEVTSLITSLVNNNNTSQLAKDWLNAAKAKISEIVNSNKTDEQKQEFINNALISIQNVSNNNCSIEVLEQESSTNSVFSSLQTTVLNNSAAYRAYKKTGEITSLITSLVNNNNTSQLAKDWLNAAQTKINEIMNSNKTDAEKETLINNALTSIQNVSNNNCSIEVLEQESSANSVFSALQASVLNNSATYRAYKKNKEVTSLITSLVNNNNTSQLAKSWLNAAQTKINEIMSSNKTDAEKETLLNSAFISIQNVSNNNCSIESLEQESSANSVFNALQASVLENNSTYKVYKKGKEVTSLITSLVNNNNTSQLAKDWLNAAQTVINGIVNSNKTDAEKETLINNALTSIQNVANNNCSIEVLEQESSANGVFGSLQETVLENSEEYQIYKINNTYSEQNIAIINGLSTNTGLSKIEILQQFIAAGVTDEQLSERSETLLNKINNGETFVNSAAVALSTVLNIDKKLVGVQLLAAAVANGSTISLNSSLEDQLTAAKMNGNTNAAIYTSCTLDDVISNLKAGEGIVLKVLSGVCSVSVVKKNANCFIVTDKDFTQNGIVVGCEYTADGLRKLMNNETAEFRFILNGLIYTGTRNYWYYPADDEGKISFVTTSTGIREGEDSKLNTKYVEPMIASINNLLNASGTSQLAKTWLNEAKEIINGVINANESVPNEEAKLQQLEKSIQRVVEQNASIASILQETSNNNLLSSLQEEVLSKDDNINNIIYPFYVQNVQESVSAINNLLDNEDLGEVEQDVLNGVYNLVVNVLNEIINIVNSGNGDYSAQEQWLQQAAASIENIKNDNASFTVLDQETQEGKVFAPLRETLESAETFQVYQTFGDLGAKAIRSFAKYMNVLESVVFQQFVRFNVTAERLQNVANSLINVINKKANFFNCASLAVSKYLGIERITAVIQDVAADISLGHGFGTDWMGTVATSTDSVEKVLQINGVENATLCAVSSIEDLMTGLQVGEQAILSVFCYGLGGHAITIKRESNGWGVFDTNRNGGEEVIYTPENFITLMTGTQGTSVQGVTINGDPFSASVYYTAIQQYQSYEWVYDDTGYITGYERTYPQGITIITDAEGILSKRDEHALLK